MSTTSCPSADPSAGSAASAARSCCRRRASSFFLRCSSSSFCSSASRLANSARMGAPAALRLPASAVGRRPRPRQPKAQAQSAKNPRDKRTWRRAARRCAAPSPPARRLPPPARPRSRPRSRPAQRPPSRRARASAAPEPRAWQVSCAPCLPAQNRPQSPFDTNSNIYTPDEWTINYVFMIRLCCWLQVACTFRSGPPRPPRLALQPASMNARAEPCSSARCLASRWRFSSALASAFAPYNERAPPNWKLSAIKISVRGGSSSQYNLRSLQRSTRL